MEVKEVIREADTAARIRAIDFTIMSDVDMANAAGVEVTSRQLYTMPERTPAIDGCLDPRLGPIDKRARCGTCGDALADCPGHFGYIKLPLPVFHIGYFKPILVICQMVCKTCSRVLVAGDQRQAFLNKLRHRTTSATSHVRGALLRKVWEACKKVKICPYCRASNGTVKKLTSLRLVHFPEGQKKETTDAEPEQWDDHLQTISHDQEPKRSKRGRRDETDVPSRVSGLTDERRYTHAIEGNPEIQLHLGNIADDITPDKALYLFSRIPDEDVELLDMDPEVNRPEKLILTALPVPPTCIRPSVCSDPSAGSTEDDLTMKLTDIVHVNEIIQQARDRGAAIGLLMEPWEFLQMECARYINSDSPGLPPTAATGAKPLRGLSQRLKGKTGRFRGNLSGKRVDFSGRTVISPDPNLRIDEVGVPERVARILTYPERVTIHNIKRIQENVTRGPDSYPGANFVEFPDGTKRFLRYGNRQNIARSLKVGCVVERHLIDGDVVLFNRQPSLHRISIMAHRIRVHPHRTFRFNECVCNPYNADFDGDEMNLHVPQTEEARAEAIELMSVRQNLVTPRNGEPLVAAIQDFITCAFLLTSRDMFFDRADFSRVVSFMSDAMEKIHIPPPVIIKPVRLWTGKQIFESLIRGSVSDPAEVHSLSTDCKEKGFLGGKDSSAPEMCPNEGFVSIRCGEIVSGRLGKKSLGGGSKDSVLFRLARECGNAAAGNAMNRLAKLSARWIGDCGFSIGVDDVTPSEIVLHKKRGLVETGFQNCEKFIEDLRVKQLPPRPGCTPEETLEALLNSELSKIREDAGRVCISELNVRTNAALTMALAGSKGSTINISQMVTCVGQQTVSGSRVPDGFHGRSLPHFETGLSSRTPKAKGFVENSFHSGLTCTEFFFHTMGGREGLVDTAVKTAETGYMQRRLMKALEDLGVQYDSTVRASDGTIVQFRYGDDGLDPLEMEGSDGKPVDFRRLLIDSTSSDCNGVGRVSPSELRDLVAKWVGDDSPSDLVQICSGKFLQDLRDFWEKECRSQEKALENSIFSSDSVAGDAGADNVVGLRAIDVETFFESLSKKMLRCHVEPGTCVGAIGAQSIGEPGTQMTLKTFHFAGVASMNITLGVPRIKEIINASKSIATPIIEAELVSPKDLSAAKVVKNRVEPTSLGEVVEYIKEVYGNGRLYMAVKLDRSVIESQLLDISVASICGNILSTPKLKLLSAEVQIVTRDKFRIFPPSSLKMSMFNRMELLKQLVPKVTVCGLPSTGRAIIKEDNGVYKVIVEGTNTLGVMGVPGVKGTHVVTNHVIAAENSLGIEAARTTIMSQIQYTMSEHGMSIDSRHVMLLADVMSFRGEILGITRFGIVKMKTSTLMLASFEMTVDHLFDASVHTRRDDVVGVSECIIMGIPIPLGTGLFRLLKSTEKPRPLPKKRPTLMEAEY